MPRKPRPPLDNLRIEGLSTGINPYLVDDLGDDGLIAQPNAKPLLGTEEIKRKKAQERRAQAIDKAMNELVKAKIILHAGDKIIEIEKPNKPWRRM